MSKSTTKQGTKRKSLGALPDARSAKQSKLTIDSFFSRKVTVRLGSGLDGVAADAEEKVLDVVLSDEQVKVMRMVVDEGKNVFFTGSAGTSSPSIFFSLLASFLSYHFLYVFLPKGMGYNDACAGRHREVFALEGHHHSAQKEACVQARGRLCNC